MPNIIIDFYHMLTSLKKLREQGKAVIYDFIPFYFKKWEIK
jgi:hypothetical protein